MIPAWLQERHNLWNAHLTLLNGTSIPYRQLTIPACQSCNGDRLGPIESRVRQAVASGPGAVAALDRLDLFLWLGKIVYGLLYKEGFLKHHRSRQRSGSIVPRELLEEFAMHHYFLQAARVPMRFNECFPASILVFEVQEPVGPQFRFDFRDCPPGLALSIRMGRVGILAALQDGGAQQNGFADYFDPLQAISLHPLQFLELTAAFFYKSQLFNRTPKFLIAEAKDHLLVHMLPLRGFSLKPIYSEWHQDVYASILSFHTGQPIEVTFDPPDRVMSWIRNDTSDVNFMDIEEYPWPEGPVRRPPPAS